MMFFNYFFDFFYKILMTSSNKVKEHKYRKEFDIHSNARLHYIENIWLKGRIEIGSETYLNSGRLVSGKKSKIKIGKRCAIGHNVNFIAITHDLIFSTGPEENRPFHEDDILIGDDCWIGTNVFIKEGVVLGDDCIVAANSVVTKSFPSGSIIAGIPAKIIKTKEEIKNERDKI